MGILKSLPAMEQAPRSSGQQQNRQQQPVYDVRNGGHYGNKSFSMTTTRSDIAFLNNHDIQRHACMLTFVSGL